MAILRIQIKMITGIYIINNASSVSNYVIIYNLLVVNVKKDIIQRFILWA
jgi:hypothetical protein